MAGASLSPAVSCLHPSRLLFEFNVCWQSCCVQFWRASMLPCLNNISLVVLFYATLVSGSQKGVLHITQALVPELSLTLPCCFVGLMRVSSHLLCNTIAACYDAVLA